MLQIIDSLTAYYRKAVIWWFNSKIVETDPMIALLVLSDQEQNQVSPRREELSLLVCKNYIHTIGISNIS